MFTVPTLQGFADYTEIVQLGGLTYRLRWIWNARAECWFVTVLGAGGDVIVAGKRVVLEWPLLRQHVQNTLPDGAIMALDITGQRVEPGREDLRDDVAPVVFVPTAELASAVAGTLL